MPQGYQSLVNRRSEVEVAVEGKGGAVEPHRESRTEKNGVLHVVEVDRRQPNRFDASSYGPELADRGRVYPFFKRAFDLVGASIAILGLSPLLIGIVAICYATGGSPIFRHRRVGRKGVLFDCLKFRTMVNNADEVLQDLLGSDRQIMEEWLRDHKLKDDPRVTRLGRLLRQTSLDELPQLWNVLCGDMSLVGPRPVVPDELRRYGTRAPTYLSALPGITGLWQVSGRNDTDYRRRVALDVCYIQSRSILLDSYILVKTLPAVFAKNGAY
jgi:lipopolysaccharide/colanic/teichoic acid biosynthesis glycosyltransferase